MSTAPFRLTAKLPWPLPALTIWSCAWAIWFLTQACGGSASGSVLLGVLLGIALALGVQGPWRRALCALGFPVSAWAQGAAAAWPVWAWPLLLGVLLLAYPLRAWRDAPFFPTPKDALRGLEQWVAEPKQVLDAGCGLGHGLRALRFLWPRARLVGVEWSPALAWLARRFCPWAEVVRGDMWAASWAGYELVYVFQRPESMERVWAKARAEMASTAWLVSLEFAVPGVTATACLQRESARPLWIYRVGRPTATQPQQVSAQSGPRRADNQLSSASPAHPAALSTGAQGVLQSSN